MDQQSHTHEHHHRHQHEHADDHGDEHRHRGISVDHHDWHDPDYVNEWIDKDVTRDEERRPIIREMLSHAPFPSDAPVQVLDVGGGYGVLTSEVLKAFPNAQVTLQDYSAPMFQEARLQLAAHAGRVNYVLRDFSLNGWTEGIGGPFDLAVSGIAIHNLGDEAAMRQVYSSVFSILRPGGAFLDMDYFGPAGVERHLEWLREAGFTNAQCPLADGNRAMLVAFRAK